MAGCRIRDIADARTCLMEAGRSGTTRAQWCRKHGIDGRSLHAWYLNLGGRKRRPVSAPTLKLVELVADPSASSRYVVRLGDVSIEVDAGFDETALRRLLAVVSSC